MSYGKFKLISCKAELVKETEKASNLLNDDKKLFVSYDNKNVDIFAKYEGEDQFQLSHVLIRNPSNKSVVKTGLIFFSNDEIKPNSEYDDFTKEKFDALAFKVSEPTHPICFFEFEGGQAEIKIEFKEPIKGKFAQIKFLSTCGSVLISEFVGFFGENSAPPKPILPYDFLFKFVIVGDSGAGKSSLLLRFSDDTFTTSFITTVGVDFKMRTIELDGKVIKLQIWDTAGQERFRTITSAYYRGAHAILLCYDTTDRNSFSNIGNWYGECEKYAAQGTRIALIGTKSDLVDQRLVSNLEGQELASTLGLAFHLDTSAKTAMNVETAFINLARECCKS